jgi:hypothetical protein
MPSDTNNGWLTVEQAYPLLRPHFRTLAALRHHLWKREANGLAAADAVRVSPLGRLLVNPARVNAWVIGEGSGGGPKVAA